MFSRAYICGDTDKLFMLRCGFVRARCFKYKIILAKPSQLAPRLRTGTTPWLHPSDFWRRSVLGPGLCLDRVKCCLQDTAHLITLTWKTLLWFTITERCSWLEIPCGSLGRLFQSVNSIWVMFTYYKTFCNSVLCTTIGSERGSMTHTHTKPYTQIFWSCYF